tara:strand:- start:1961 stop:2332 length:372 start_codon:yes stop_codon:yes gene_type:complete
MKAIYNTASGVVRVFGTYSDSEVEINLREGESYIDGHPSGMGDHRVVDGVLVADEVIVNIGLAIREMRDEFLAGCDWTQVPDSPLTAEKRSEWQMYRQKLRDLPADYEHVTALEDVVWPTAPS